MILSYQCLEVIQLKNRLKRLYEQGKITDEGLQNAVAKGWITEGEYNEIING